MVKSRHINYIKNMITPCVIFGISTGAITSFIVFFFKYMAEIVINFSMDTYAFLAQDLRLVPIAVLVLFLFSLLINAMFKYSPDTKGGGIATSVAILRGVITFKYLRTLIIEFFASLLTFFIAVPLGNEGPCVQMGTAVGSGVVKLLGKKHRAWHRYSMTGGACAGFAVATHAPISGILFAIEDAHQKVSPLIILISSISVMSAMIVNDILGGIFGHNTAMFEHLNVSALPANYLPLAVAIGVMVGIFSIFFLKLYTKISRFINVKLKHINKKVLIFAVLIVTFIFGLINTSFIGTGHDIIEKVLYKHELWYMLVLILIYRCVVTLSATSVGITGGLFLPTMAVGALVSGIFAEILLEIGVLPQEYYMSVVVLGITGSLAGSVKIPLTAMVFSIEVLNGLDDIVAVILVSSISYFITEIFGQLSINDIVIENKVKSLMKKKASSVYDCFVVASEKSFVVGKSIKDILWPCNLFVLSIRNRDKNPIVDEHGDKIIQDGDILHIRFATSDENETKLELESLVGVQEIELQKVIEI